MSGQQPEPDWWRAQGGQESPSTSYPQAGAPVPPPRAPGDSKHGGDPEKGSRSRAFREWIQTTTGIISLFVAIAALGGGGAAIAANSGSGHNPNPAPTVSSTSQTSAPSATQPAGFVGAASSAQLQQALLPAQELGSGATITNSNTNLSQLVGICGEPIPSGAQATAFELLQDSQTGQDLGETIVAWDSADAASNAVSSSRNAIDQTGSCSISSGGVTEELIADNAGSPPPECSGGQYLAAQASISSTFYSGYRVVTQCGHFTISIAILANAASGVVINQETADGYLNTAAGRLQNTVG
jgi:hypothetical protein